MSRRHELQFELFNHADVPGRQGGIPRERHGYGNLFADHSLARYPVLHVAFEFGVDAERRQLRKGLRKRRLMRKRLNVRKAFRLASDESGSELVEFGLCALILMGLLVGVIEFAMAMYTYHFLSGAAQRGSRFAMVRGSTWSQYETEDCSTSAPPNFTMAYNCTASSTDIQNYVQSLATAGINSSKVTVNSSWTGETPDGATCATTNSQGCLVKVTVSYNFNFLPIEKLSALSLSATSEGVILQ